MNNRLRITATLHCDLLIIGSGGAGLRCAANVLDKRPETRVIALTKNAHPQKSHTSTAQGGLAAVDPGDPEDKTIYHMFDTWKGSDCTADQDVIKKSAILRGSRSCGWKTGECISAGTPKENSVKERSADTR